MNHVDHACVFVRADGDRLLAAERLVTGFAHLFNGALAEVDLAYRAATRSLVVVVRLAADRLDDRLRARLAYWTARAGGRASPVDAMSEADRQAFRAHLDQCEVRASGVKPAELFDRASAFFTQAGAPAARRRSAADRPILALDVGGPGWEGVSYRPEARALFIAAPIAPPSGDDMLLVFRIPGADRPIGVRSRVLEVRTTAEAGPGRPAGFALLVPETATAVHAALKAHAPTGASEVRAAPRFNVKAPVKVLVPSPPPGAPLQAPGPAAPARAVIEYASDRELEADFVENLSQGGAFIRSARPQPVGTPIAVDFRLPNGAELKAEAVVAFVNANGMGVRFTLDEEAEATLQAAIAHISARSRRALVVDDEELVRRTYGEALADRGFQVIAANDGKDGLRVLSEELLALDLLVTDVFMPNMDGEAFLKTIRSAGGESELAIVVITGRMQDGLEKRLEEAGADAVLDKALGPDLVAQAADAVLERKRLGRER